MPPDSHTVIKKMLAVLYRFGIYHLYHQLLPPNFNKALPSLGDGIVTKFIYNANHRRHWPGLYIKALFEQADIHTLLVEHSNKNNQFGANITVLILFRETEKKSPTLLKRMAA